MCLQVLRDFVKILNPEDLIVWNRRWLLRLDGNERQKNTPATCSNQSGEGHQYLA
jgi:hypothetical protein